MYNIIWDEYCSKPLTSLTKAIEIALDASSSDFGIGTVSTIIHSETEAILFSFRRRKCEYWYTAANAITS